MNIRIICKIASSPLKLDCVSLDDKPAKKKLYVWYDCRVGLFANKNLNVIRKQKYNLTLLCYVALKTLNVWEAKKKKKPFQNFVFYDFYSIWG